MKQEKITPLSTNFNTVLGNIVKAALQENKSYNLRKKLSFHSPIMM